MADKAIEALQQHRESLPEDFKVELLLDKLLRFDPVPPKLSASAGR